MAHSGDRPLLDIDHLDHEFGEFLVGYIERNIVLLLELVRQLRNLDLFNGFIVFTSIRVVCDDVLLVAVAVESGLRGGGCGTYSIKTTRCN